MLNSVVHAWIETFLGDISIQRAEFLFNLDIHIIVEQKMYRFVSWKIDWIPELLEFVFLNVELKGRESVESERK